MRIIVCLAVIFMVLNTSGSQLPSEKQVGSIRGSVVNGEAH